MSQVDLTVPDIGNFEDILVVDVLVKKGDTIEVDAPLVTLETDKASMDVPATTAGTVTEVLLKAGDKVSKGSVIARVDTDAAAGAAAKPAAAQDSSDEGEFSAAFDADELERTVTQPVLTQGGAAAAKAPASKTSDQSSANSATEARNEGPGDTVRMPAPDLSRFERAEVEFNRSTQVLVLGSGPGGYTAAFRAADLGMKVTLVERWS